MKDLGLDIGELNEYDHKQKAVDLLVEQRLLPPGADVKFGERITQTILRASRIVLNHSVKKIENNIERITVAFNMQQFKNWEKDTNLIWVNKK
jgi:hypothetical protein